MDDVKGKRKKSARRGRRYKQTLDDVYGNYKRREDEEEDVSRYWMMFKESYKRMEDEEEDVSRYCMLLRKEEAGN